jgi:hypothetical protein
VFRTLVASIPDLQPRFSLSDGADAIFNAASSVWPGIVRVMCYSHVHMNCQKKANTVRDTVNRDCILDDLNIIQLAPSEEHFQAAVQTFIARYSELSLETASFVQYFVAHWCDNIPCWYEGINSGFRNVKFWNRGNKRSHQE